MATTVSERDRKNTEVQLLILLIVSQFIKERTSQTPNHLNIDLLTGVEGLSLTVATSSSRPIMYKH